MAKHRFGLKWGDILLMAALFLVALGLFFLPFLKEEAATVEIRMAETGQVRTIPLTLDATYEIAARDVELTVQVKDGAVSITHSTCRDQICRNTPPISRAGQSIVCAPAGVVVQIMGEEAVVDGVSG